MNKIEKYSHKCGANALSDFSRASTMPQVAEREVLEQIRSCHCPPNKDGLKYGIPDGSPDSLDSVPFYAVLIQTGGLEEVCVNSHCSEYRNAIRVFESLTEIAEIGRTFAWQQAINSRSMSKLLDGLLPRLFPGHSTRHHREKGDLWIVEYLGLNASDGDKPYNIEVRINDRGDFAIKYWEQPSKSAVVVGTLHYKQLTVTGIANSIESSDFAWRDEFVDCMTASFDLKSRPSHQFDGQ